jgi:hypothetical protein
VPATTVVSIGYLADGRPAMCRRNRRVNADRGSHEAPAPSAGTAEAPVASAPRRRALKAAGAGSRPDQQQTKSPARLREIAGCRSNRRRPTRSESGFRLSRRAGFVEGSSIARNSSSLKAGCDRLRRLRHWRWREGQSSPARGSIDTGPLCCTSLSKSTRSRRARRSLRNHETAGASKTLPVWFLASASG